MTDVFPVIPGYDPGSLSECLEMENGKWEIGNGHARLFRRHPGLRPGISLENGM